jgi:hypothetical protein
MNYRTSLFAAGAALAFAGLANAQNDYAINWAMTANPTTNAYLTGPTLFTVDPALGINYPGPGDSIRKCHGIDQTQGGSNQDGTWTNENFRVIQAYDPFASEPGVNIGLVSMHSATINSLSGDACFSPFADALQPVAANYSVSVAGVIGIVTGTIGSPAPTFFGVVFRWLTPVSGPTVLGTDSNGFPLLSNVIFEVQGPLNDNQSTNQYYLASTAEVTGVNPIATGGITNGNSQLASALFAATADQTNAVASTRLTSVQGTTIFFETMPFGQPGQLEMRNDMSFDTPQVWATKDGNEGTGGPDWSISGPVSTIDVRFLDVLGGAQSTSGTAVFNPCILFNSAFFLWSATPGTAMLQDPMSWDTSLVPFFPPQPGSFALGTIPTARQGAQTVPVNFDALTAAFLGVAPLSIGNPITQAASQYADAGHPLALPTLFQGGFTAITNGVVTLSGGGGPLAAVPNPALAGLQLGIAGLGMQFDGCVGGLVFTELGSSLHISLQ